MSEATLPPSVVARPARCFIFAIGLLTVATVAVAQATTGTTFDIPLLAVCTAICAIGSFYEVQLPSGPWLQPALPAFVMVALLLGPLAATVAAIAVFVPGAIRRRESAYRVAFNSASLCLAGVAAGAVTGLLDHSDQRSHDVAGLFAGTVVLIAVNHGLLSVVSSLARGVSLVRAAAAGLRFADSFGMALAIDGALALTGASLAALYSSYPEALPLAAGPFALACSALWLPKLRHASQTDAKTGLFNFTHFRQLTSAALQASERTGDPVSVLMIDLDHLRAVNNRHGHLAGDELIAAVATIIEERSVNRGSAARFGGEEFCVVLPGATAQEASAVAEEIRAHVADRHVDTDGPPATVSVGIATYPEHGPGLDAVLHAADMALYDAKLGGRNRVRVAPPRAATALPADHSAPTVAVILDTVAATGAAEQEAPEEPMPDGARRAWIPPVSALLICGTAFTALLADHSPIGADPLLFVALIASVVILDALRIDLFERLQTSPASLPVLALAALFGPLGPIAGEGIIVLARVARKVPAIKWSFDFGALSVSGIAAAVAFSALQHAGVGLIPAGLVSGAAYYAVNIPLVAVVIWLARGTTPLTNFRESLAWLLPHYAAFGALAGLFVTVWEKSAYGVFALFGVPTALLWIGEQQYLSRSRSSVEDLRRSHTELEQVNVELRRLLTDNQALLSRLQSAYLSTITSLARTIEAKDPYTGGHTDRVSKLAVTLAAEMDFTPEELHAVEVGAAIHDIGKIGVPDATLLKPGPLTPDERRVIEQHPETSSYIVAELDVPAIVKQMVRSHHERYDGGGYPDRLVGEEIPLSARILAVADALDAMTSDRPYRSAMTLNEAVAGIHKHAGTQFCPDVVAALDRCVVTQHHLVAVA